MENYAQFMLNQWASVILLVVTILRKTDWNSHDNAIITKSACDTEQMKIPYTKLLFCLELLFQELESWVSDFQLPNAVWLAGFFNPQSFLTAIMQQMARKNEWPLDKMALQCDVTKKNKVSAKT